MNLRIMAALCAALTSIAATSAATVPFLEDFKTDAANWRDATGSADLDWAAAGGPDGSSYAYGTFNFVNSAPDDTPAVFRGHDEYNSSGNNFVGDWIADGVTEFSFQVRHDAVEPLSLFTRFAGPTNFPGAVGLEFAPILPNQWTEVTVLIEEDNPAFVYEGSTFAGVFSNVGHLQIGVIVSDTLSGLDQDFTFDVDKISIVPEPATAVGCLFGLLALRRRSSARGGC